MLHWLLNAMYVMLGLWGAAAFGIGLMIGIGQWNDRHPNSRGHRWGPRYQKRVVSMRPRPR